ISAISFMGYFAIRFLGKRRGIALTGALGGLASSTAVTLSMCARVKEASDPPDIRLAATFAIIVANAIMPIRLIIAVAVVNIDVAWALFWPLTALCAPGLAIAGLIWIKLTRQESAEPGSVESDSMGP